MSWSDAAVISPEPYAWELPACSGAVQLPNRRKSLPPRMTRGALWYFWRSVLATSTGAVCLLALVPAAGH